MKTMKSFLIVMLALPLFCLPKALAQQASSVPNPAEPALVTPQIIEKPEVTLLDSEGAGKLYQVGEHLVCVMEGAPAEMGFQHGRLLAKKVHHDIKEGYCQKAIWGKGYAPDYVTAQSERMEKHIPPECIDEMKGLVKGLKAAKVDDVTYEEIRLGVTEAEILHYPPGAPPACSNFACWGQWTTDGRLLHGRNLDWNVRADAQDDAVILVWRPKGGRPFMMVGWAGGIGSVSGMNAKGITIGEMTSASPDATFDGMPLFIIMRRVLEKASTLNEAVGVIQTGPRTTGWNMVIGDAKIPDARALEIDAKVCDVYGPMDPKENAETGHWSMPDAVRRTNHPVGAEKLLKLAQLYGPKINLNIQTMEQLKAAIPFVQLQNTWQRYDWLGKEIQAKPKGIDIKEALQLLSNGPVFNNATLHSWVFDPKNKVAYVAVAGNNPPVTASKRPYTRIDLGEWFK